MSTEVKIEQLKKDKTTLVEWLYLCIRKEDWHGVMDAAADIREVIARIQALEDIKS